MNELTRLIRNDCKPSLGVTEPGAIALAVAAAKERARALRSEVSGALRITKRALRALPFAEQLKVMERGVVAARLD